MSAIARPPHPHQPKSEIWKPPPSVADVICEQPLMYFYIFVFWYSGTLVYLYFFRDPDGFNKTFLFNLSVDMVRNFGCLDFLPNSCLCKVQAKQLAPVMLGLSNSGLISGLDVGHSNQHQGATTTLSANLPNRQI